tara:strand:+ start:427 stop:1383 length:957 start_codon:yes stop_codon:yes gene_type:complete
MRNVNIDRDPMSSEDVSSYKDFKSILKKHAQTTNDLNKINSSKSAGWYLTRGGAVALVAFASGLFFMDNNKEEDVVNAIPVTVIEDVAKVEDKKVVKAKVEWTVMLNSAKDPIHEHFDFDELSSERIEYIQFGESKSIKTLLPTINPSDLEYAKDKKIFRVSTGFSLKISANKSLFKMEKGNWVKIDHHPYEFKKLVKPKKMEVGKPGIRIDVVGFGKEFQEFENMIWQPLQSEDLDASFFDYEWPDGSIVETNTQGIYNITLVDGEMVKQFYGYPVLQKYAYKKAIKEYTKKLVKQQDLMKKAPKAFDIEKGIYTIE